MFSPMTPIFRTAALIALMPAFATAQEACPPGIDFTAQIAGLLNDARAAPDQASGSRISNQMWAIWTKAPDARAQDLLDSGMSRRELYDFATAESVFDTLIAYCPAYAEGWNQRAFVRFLRQDFDRALPDLDEALRLNPTHVGALSGKALTLFHLGREAEGQAVLRAALKLNPWLAERAYLRDVPRDDF